MQCVPSGVFFARAKVVGIAKRASLETDVFPVAQNRLRAKKKQLQKPPEPDPPAVTCKDAKRLSLPENMMPLAAVATIIYRRKWEPVSKPAAG